MNRLLTLIALFLLRINACSAIATTNPFTINFDCCGIYVNCWDPAYSNATIQVVLPYFQDFAKKLNLHIPQLNEVTEFRPGHLLKTKDQLEGGGLFNGHSFGFERGHVCGYGSPMKYVHLQDYSLLDKAYGPVKMTKEEAIDLARQSIKKLGYSLEDVLAEYEPVVKPIENFGTNVLPRYRINWVDPRHGGSATEFEINANTKQIESISFRWNHNLTRPSPKINIAPGPLDPQLPFQAYWITANNSTNDINHEYGYRLVPVVFKAVEDWAHKLSLSLALPITTNQVKRFSCSNEGGVARAELSLTNGWEFTYNCVNITYAGSPRRFFESDNLPFHIKNFVGQKRLTDEQAIELVRKTIAKLGHGPDVTHTDTKPKLTYPKTVEGMPTIPRLLIEWTYPDPQKPLSVSIRADVDCDKATVEALEYNVTELWKKGPDLGVPIGPPQQPPVK